jgi:phosphoribosyl 1,2-cyclic phosphodiesterase
MPIQFAVLASGSRGNSTWVCGEGPGMLVDVGIGPRAVGERLASIGASWSRVGAVVLTHTHSDHVDTAAFAELARRRIALYCHEGHRENLATDAGFQKLEEAQLLRLYDDRPLLTSAGFRLEPIELCHDGGPTYGFRIEASAGRRERPVKIGYLADTGTWSEKMAEILTDVDVLGVEFNHDVALQKSSRRPVSLIARNLSDDGHLSNRQGAELVQAVLARSIAGALRHVVLLHLSEQCNAPELAIQVAAAAVQAAGRRAKVHAARQSPAFPNLWVAPSTRSASASAIGPPRSQTARPNSERGEHSSSRYRDGLLFGNDDQD